MFDTLAKKIFGTKNDREIKRMQRFVVQINALEETYKSLSDEAIRGKTSEFKSRLKKGETLDDLLVEAFAVVREASSRTLKMRHYDVQLIGGITLHEGRVAEMRTGEGKTLVATLAVYLHALSGKGVHVVTVNDYLAERDANWMKPVYDFLCLSVGVILSRQPQNQKQEAYDADITYGTNNEFGFDYLRNNMALSLEDRVQRELNFAVVDEVDSILIDEARTPLIISGPAEDSSQLYIKINALIPQLTRAERDEAGEITTEGHYIVEEKHRQTELTEEGHELLESLLVKQGLLEEGDSLYAAHSLILLHHVHSALKAHALYQKDVDYVVQEGAVVIVDEHTGRTMPGRRWSEGLHQAVEAKEGLVIQQENQTLASTTFQNYFRLYSTLSGMTGTADTEAFEFREIYGLDVVVIPTNKPMIRKDYNDLIFNNTKSKYNAIIEDIRENVGLGRPVLVGTASIETSEYVSQLLKKAKIPHEVLNAKQHQREAEIIAQAGRPGAVTIATNMAGRGTDIVLGGNPKTKIDAMDNPTSRQIQEVTDELRGIQQQVIEAGGLHIIATERHESRRIDNQLRGRSGRQGDPGSSRFYLSLEDRLMRIFTSDNMRAMLGRLGFEDGEALEHKMVTRSIENAQRKVEAHNFDVRKSLLEYDNVANDQRRVIYEQRTNILSSESIEEVIGIFRAEVFDDAISRYIPPGSIDEMWDVPGLEHYFEAEFASRIPISQWLDESHNLDEIGLRQKILEAFNEAYQAKTDELGDASVMRHLEKQVMLVTLDRLWKEHLASMDYLRQSIGLRGYGHKNPKQEYKREGFELFTAMLDNFKFDVVRMLTTVQLAKQEDVDRLEQQRRDAAELERSSMNLVHENFNEQADDDTPVQTSDQSRQTPIVRTQPKVGRNEPCPCGSGKKFKQCHGRLSA